MSGLVAVDLTRHYEELDLLGLTAGHRMPEVHRAWHHGTKVGGKPGDRKLLLQYTVNRYSLETAASVMWGIVRWRHLSVSVSGALQIRLADQQRIGRKRAPGERSPAPLPDWYELAHVIYEHGPELGFDPRMPTFQYLPGRFEEGLNIAEALHVRQPA